MDSLVGEIISSTRDEDIQYATKVLTSKASYDNYFTSEPQLGSIVEDIAELDAEIAQLERELKNGLLGEKSVVIDILLGSSWTDTLSEISEQIEQLWELNKERPTNEEAATGRGDIFADNSESLHEVESEIADAFHEALERLRSLHSTERDTNLVTVLNNIDNINEILELPTLVSTCIRTGHYQEVLMLHSYTKNLQKKFPNFEMINIVVKMIQELISTKMLDGLVKLLSTNLTLSSMKKILSYLEAIEPFDTNIRSLQQLLLTMRYKFVTEEIESYQILKDTNDSVKEMLIKRKIECIREHVYGTVSVFNSLFQSETKCMYIPLLDQVEPISKDLADSQDTKDETATKKTEFETSLPLLKFINECTNYLTDQLHGHKDYLTESVCLQLVYCSFRLGDANLNYHNLFMNKLLEKGLFSQAVLESAIAKRLELAARY